MRKAKEKASLIWSVAQIWSHDAFILVIESVMIRSPQCSLININKAEMEIS